MSKEELKQLLKENLILNIKEEKDIGGYYVIVQIQFDGQAITDDFVNISMLK